MVASLEHQHHRQPETPSEASRFGGEQKGKASQDLDDDAYDDPPKVLSADEKAALDKSAGRGLMRAVMAQGVMAVGATAVAWVVAGTAAGLSALAGAGAYFVPNTVFALRLLLNAHQPGRASPFTFFLGEAFKLGATILLLGLAVHFGHERIVWPALLLGLLCVMKGYVLLLLSGKSS